MSRKKNTDDKALSSKRPRGKNGKAKGDVPAGNEPGSIASRPQPARKADKTYPLRLTEQQRASMIHCTRLRKKLKERLAEAGEGTQVVGVTRKELGHLEVELSQAALFAAGPDKKRLVAVLHRVSELLAPDDAGPSGGEEPMVRKTAPKEGGRIYQFKITLLDIKPAIWRRIRVPDGTLADLHEYIQTAFGWLDYHLHQFAIDGEWYGPPAPDGMDFDLETRDETEVRLSKLIPRSGRKPRWVYEYDFGDGWRHEVLFEGFPASEPNEKYPVCVEGARACPPEDCGGPWGYADFVEAITDPRHERHEELLEWGGPFDPEAFDTKQATREMRKVR